MTACRIGLTLVELLVASVIISICLLGASRAAWSCLKASESIGQSQRKGEQVRRAFELVARDLRCAIVDEMEDGSMVFQGRGDDENGTLSFTTLPGDANEWRVGVRSSLRRVRYAQEGNQLVRSEVSLNGSGQASSSALVEDVEHMSFHFISGDESLDRWDSDKALPQMVEVTLFADAGTYRTMILLPGANSPQEREEGDS